MFLRVELIARSWSFFSRKRAQRPMDRKIFALRAPKQFGLRPPGSGDPFSNAHPRHAGGGVATQGPRLDRLQASLSYASPYSSNHPSSQP